MGGGLNRSEHLNRSEGKPRRLPSTLGVRLAGAALCTAGLAFIGFGTVGSQWSLFSAKNTGVVADPGCDSSTTNCLNESFEGNTIAQDKLNCDFTSRFPNEDAFLFVLPSKGNSQPTFVPGTFFAVFQGIGSPVQGTVGVPDVGNGDQKFAVVYVAAGSVLEEAYSQATNGTPVFGDDFNVTGGCEATTTTTTTGSTATVSTTKTVTAPGTTATTTVTGPTTTTTAPGTTATTTKTVSTATTVTSPTTVTGHTTATNTETTTVNTTVTTTTTAPGTTVTVTTTLPTTVTVTTVTTNNHTATTTVTAPTTVTAGTTLTNTATATTTKTVTAGSASSPASSTSSSSSSTPTSGVAAATTTPSTGSGSDIAFGTGLALLVAGGGLIAGATRITRRKKS